MDYIETYRGFEIFSDPGPMQIIAFWEGAQVSEYVGEGLEDVKHQIDYSLDILGNV